jgi:dipeptidyl aminopeptidase/acylaminoacyl peptidase
MPEPLMVNNSIMGFENKGHEVLKYENRVTCYKTIADFFVTYLHP